MQAEVLKQCEYSPGAAKGKIKVSFDGNARNSVGYFAILVEADVVRHL